MNGTLLILIICAVAGFAYGVVQKAYVKNTVITHILLLLVCSGVVIYKFPEDGLVNAVASSTLPAVTVAALTVFCLVLFWLLGIVLRAFVTKKPEELHIHTD